jgi:hypothetical protein
MLTFAGNIDVLFIGLVPREIKLAKKKRRKTPFAIHQILSFLSFNLRPPFTSFEEEDVKHANVTSICNLWVRVQFHQRLTRCFFTNSLAPLKYKPKT